MGRQQARDVNAKDVNTKPRFPARNVERKPIVKKKGWGPESEFYDTLKGEEVLIVLNIVEETAEQYPVAVEATLLWVDRYSIGVRDALGKERLIMKNVIATIEKA